MLDLVCCFLCCNLEILADTTVYVPEAALPTAVTPCAHQVSAVPAGGCTKRSGILTVRLRCAAYFRTSHVFCPCDGISSSAQFLPIELPLRGLFFVLLGLE